MPSIRAEFGSFVVLNTFIAKTTKLKTNFKSPKQPSITSGAETINRNPTCKGNTHLFW
jgi:hypothetical protein